MMGCRMKKAQAEIQRSILLWITNISEHWLQCIWKSPDVQGFAGYTSFVLDSTISNLEILCIAVVTKFVLYIFNKMNEVIFTISWYLRCIHKLRTSTAVKANEFCVTIPTAHPPTFHGCNNSGAQVPLFLSWSAQHSSFFSAVSSWSPSQNSYLDAASCLQRW